MDLERLRRTEYNQQYIAAMRPVFNRRALFTDTSAEYVIPEEPACFSEVTIRFRTARNNVDRVFLVCGGQKHLMVRVESKNDFDYYAYVMRLDDQKVSYYFEVQTGRITGIFDMRGLVQEVNEYYDFIIIPGFHTPDWAKGAVMYQIYTDRFCNGNLSNDVKDREYRYLNRDVHRVTDWNQLPEVCDVQNFYGGDLQGVWQKLDYLQELGVEVVYFNPLFVSPSNHKYDIQDYDYIDPHYGKIVDDGGEVLPDGVTDNSQATKYKKRTTGLKNLEASNELFIKLVEELHRRGMKVILDGVFNHCGSFNKWMDRERIYEGEKDYEPGAYISADSPYRSYFRFFKEGPENWPYNGNYDGWWGHDTLPKLNYEDSVKLENYILYIGRKWVSPPYNVDGWRLDVAADLGHSNEYNHQFWRDFRRNVKEANPNAVILAEHYGDAEAWLRGDQWDGVMNYDAFMEPVSWYFTGISKHSTESRQDLKNNNAVFWDTIRYQMGRMPAQAAGVAMNELSNHDHSRFLTRTNGRTGRLHTDGAQAANRGVNKAVFREAVLLQMTWPGAPTVYYGDEAGVTGWTDPDNRRPFPWNREDDELVQYHKILIGLRKEHISLRKGSLKSLDTEDGILAYGRFCEEERCLIVCNNREEAVQVSLPVWQIGVQSYGEMEILLKTKEMDYFTEKELLTVENGMIQLEMPPHSGILMKEV